MLALASLFVVVLASLVITRVATVMLTLTGLSRESARFQARSAFSGAGFTTSESEAVVNHPVRRRIILTLILLGNAGIVTGLGSLLLSFSTAEDSGDALTRLAVIIAGLVVFWWAINTRPVNRVLTVGIERMVRRFTDIEMRDYAGLLRFSDNWEVGEIFVEDGDWFEGQQIADLRLPDEGVIVLGIERADKRWVGAPKGDAVIHEGDTVVLYGRSPTLDSLDSRRRDADGEMEWIRSQIEFTEAYLDQQEAEHEAEAVHEPGAEAEHEPEAEPSVGEPDLVDPDRPA